MRVIDLLTFVETFGNEVEEGDLCIPLTNSLWMASDASHQCHVIVEPHVNSEGRKSKKLNGGGEGGGGRGRRGGKEKDEKNRWANEKGRHKEKSKKNEGEEEEKMGSKGGSEDKLCHLIHIHSLLKSMVFLAHLTGFLASSAISSSSCILEDVEKQTLEGLVDVEAREAAGAEDCVRETELSPLKPRRQRSLGTMEAILSS